MTDHDRVNILLVDDQPAKLLSYEVILRELQENVLTAGSAQEAFEHLLKSDIAVLLVDVYMPDLDGFELARMIREHPRFQSTAIIFISAVLMTELDFLRGYSSGAVDYVSVPIVPEILRAKVKVFAELYRKSRQLERLNRELERRVVERTAALEASTAELRKSEERLRLALDASQMGWWDYDFAADRVTWSPSLERIMGFAPESFGATFAGLLPHVHPEDRDRFVALVKQGTAEGSQSCELRFLRKDGSIRWSQFAGHLIRDAEQKPARFAGVDLDITRRKQAEDHKSMLVRELDHRAKNLLAVMQSVLRLSHAETVGEFIEVVDGRIKSLSRAHSLLSESRWQGVDFSRIVDEEIAPFSTAQIKQITAVGPSIALHPATAQSLALAIHELATNAAKYGALSVSEGRIALNWHLDSDHLVIRWVERGGPPMRRPSKRGFGTKLIATSIEHQLQGTVAFDWRPEGLICTLSVPRSVVAVAHLIDGARDPGPAESLMIPLRIPGKRILLVEDEALVALSMTEVLSELGFSVVGPIGDLPQALAAATDSQIDGAILDVNVGGHPIYPVADALAARTIPFVFVTGYSPASIDGRYAHVPTLEKPIEPQSIRRLFQGPDVRRPPAGVEAPIPALARS